MLILYKSFGFVFFLIVLISKSLQVVSACNDFSIINNLVVSILTFCYPNQSTIVLWDSSDSNLIQSLWTSSSSSSSSIPVILYNNSSQVLNPTTKHPNKVQFFIISFESNEKLEENILSLKNTPWWNIMATFLILDRSNGECENAESILKAAWSFNMLTTIFLCRDSDYKLMMFTFNPYTKSAPEPWKQIKVNSQQTDRWKVYNRQYHDKDHNICSNLDFDRTWPLDGYQINTTLAIFYSNSSLLMPDYDPSKLSTTDMVNHDIPTAFKRSLNINLTTYFFEYDFQDPMCIYNGLGQHYDLTFGALPMHAVANYTLLYPSTAFYTSMIMQKRGFYTPLEKIQNYYGIITVISGSIILSIILIVILISQKKKDFAFSMFEILRLLINTSLSSKMDTQPLRIFFFVIFVYFLIMQATFSGNLSAFLTKQVLRKTPETSKDLKDSYVKIIYIPDDVSFDYSDPILQNKVVLMDNFDCSSVVLNNSDAVCLNDILDLMSLAAEHDNLHVSKKPLASDYYSFIARNDWPLKDRADVAMIRFSDAGYSSDFWMRKYSEDVEEHIKRMEARSTVTYRPILFSDFSFAFVILAFGLVLATICFFLELFISRICKRFTVNTVIQYIKKKV